MSQTTDGASRRLGLPRGLLGMAALVVLCELFISARELDFTTLEARDCRTTRRQATAGAVGAKVLCLGDSQVKFGVLPVVLEARLGRPAFNLSVYGGQAPASYFLLRRALNAGAKPEAIVLDFEPFLLNKSIDFNRRTWPELLGLGELLELSWAVGDSGFFADMAAARALPSYRDRFEIRQNVLAALRGETPITPRVIAMHERNHVANRGAMALNRKPGQGVIDIGQWGNPLPQPWAGDPVNERYLREFFRLAESRQIPVFCLAMPVCPSLRAKYQMTDQYEAYGRALARFHAEFPGVTMIDARTSGFEEPSFLDGVHLCNVGAAAFSDRLADVLRARLGRDAEADNDRWAAMPNFRGAPADIAIEDGNQSLAVSDRLFDTSRR